MQSFDIHVCMSMSRCTRYKKYPTADYVLVRYALIWTMNNEIGLINRHNYLLFHFDITLFNIWPLSIFVIYYRLLKHASMGTHCAALLADLLRHTYKADFILRVLKNKDRKLAQTFNSSFRYIDDVLPLSNSRFCHYLHRIYPNELEVENTTDTQKSASYLDLHLEIDIG